MEFQAISSACVKCGKCIPTCTIYQTHREEVTSPRGYLDLVGAYSRGELELDSRLRDYFESCFLCTTCVEACPSSLPIDHAIESIRVEIAKKYGIAWYKKLYFYLLRHRKLMDFVFKFIAFIEPCAFKKVSGGNKIWFNKRIVFPFSKKSFLEQYSGEIKIESNNKESKLTHNKVAIFIGCLANYNYPSTGKALLKILETLKINVLIPKQECCGAPAYFTGDIDSVLFLIKKNIAYFEEFIDEVDAILIPEATCAAMLISDWNKALDSISNENERKEYKARLAKLTPKMAMASQWLYKNTDLEKILESKNKKDLKITYHDPCHARKVLKIYKEPRNLLSKNFNLFEMEEPERCCGFGGVSMQSQKYTTTLKAGIPKAKNIEKSGAEIVSAECSACRMQITNSLNQIDSKTSFKHTLELIAQNLE